MVGRLFPRLEGDKLHNWPGNGNDRSGERDRNSWLAVTDRLRCQGVTQSIRAIFIFVTRFKTANQHIPAAATVAAEVHLAC